ncbi:MAG: response regulator [Oscillospiraceae bacterium]|nr:response regulator [Oscillospiraceae bacterium]
MEKTKLLVADSAEEFCRSLTQTLGSAYRVRCCKDGNAALQLLQTFRPDICVLDLMISGLDGITVLQKAAQKGVHPVVLATTRYISEYIMSSAERLNIAYLMVKPCDPSAVAARVADMSQRIRLPVFAHPEPKTQVSNMLLSLGVPTKLRGYGYLREAVLLMVKRPAQSITKELYPAVAAGCGATAAQVERSIRSAVKNSWQRQDDTTWQMYFPTGDAGKHRPPTNSEMITCLADRVRLMLQPSEE